MNIDNKDTKVVFTFSPREYFLVHAPDSRYSNATDENGNKEMAWSLNHRIDMSYKGKDDQVGPEAIYLSDQEAEACKQAGFSYIEEVA